MATLNVVIVNTDYTYYARVGWKTRIFNVLRSPLRTKLLESWLAFLTCHFGSPFTRLVPPEYTYAKESWRIAIRDGISYKLDLSNYVDHKIYFGLENEGLSNLLANVQANFNVVDIGANIGQVALPCARRASRGRVLCFEPDPKSRSRLQENIAMNDSRNIEVLPQGLGRAPANLTLCRVNPTNPGMNRILPTNSSLYDSVQIEVTSLDKALESVSWDRVDFIKVDVEGFEMEVLEGAQETLNRCLPTLYIELDDKNLVVQGSSARLVVMWLQQHHYSVFNAATGAAVLESDRGLAGCHLDILCRPPSR